MASHSQSVSQALDRARDTQGTINAFTFIEDTSAGPDGGEGVLAGVPIAIKDLIDQAGRVTTCGSAFYREVPDRTAPCIERLEKAGALIIGRTGLHEWAFGFSSENPHFGPVRNPWDVDTSPGGSSGGSGAAVAAGITPIALGTDTGGSVRVPAALCGTYGLKVTHGAVPLDGVFPLVPSIDTVGPLADSMENIERSYRVLAEVTDPLPSLDRFRMGIPQPWVDEAPMDGTIRDAFEALVSSLQALGHTVGPVEVPDVAPSSKIVHAIAPEVRQVHRLFRDRGEPYGDDVAARLDAAEAVTDEQIAEAMTWQLDIRESFAAAFESVDFLITPTVPVRRKVIGEDLIGDRHYRSVLSYFTSLVNHALLPALAMPIASSGAPPASVQLIGPMHSDLALVAVGKHLEREGLVAFEPAPLVI